MQYYESITISAEKFNDEIFTYKDLKYLKIEGENAYEVSYDNEIHLSFDLFKKIIADEELIVKFKEVYSKFRNDNEAFNNNEIAQEIFKLFHEKVKENGLPCLSKNVLKELSPKIGQLTELEELHLPGNCLSALPDTIVQLQQLRVINLSYNNFLEIPPVLQELKSLEWIQSIGNPLISVAGFEDYAAQIEKQIKAQNAKKLKAIKEQDFPLAAAYRDKGHELHPFIMKTAIYGIGRSEQE